MSTVHCPACDRALNLPEASGVTTVQCPLCRHVFAVPPRAPPAPPKRPSLLQVDPSSAPAPPTYDLHAATAEPLLPAADRRAVASAAGWLRAAGILGATHLFCCSCVSFAFLPPADRQPTERDFLLTVAYVVGYLFQGVASLIVYQAARALEWRGSRWLVRTGGVLGVVMGLLALLMAVPVFLEAAGHLDPQRPRAPSEVDLVVMLLGLLLDVALVVCFLVGGVKALTVLTRPAVLRGVQRPAVSQKPPA